MSKTSVLVLSKQEAQDIVYDEHDEKKIAKLSDTVIDNTRWSVIHRLVVQDVASGLYYMTNYSTAATENQDERPFEYENEVIFKEAELFITHDFRLKI